MPSANDIATSIGLRQVRAALRDTDGTYVIPAGVGVGTAYGGIRAYKARALTVTPAEPVRVTAEGDDAAYYTFQESPTDTPTGELRTQVSDVDLIALLTSTKVFGSGERREIVVGSDKVGEEESIMVWGSAKAIDSEPGSATYGLRVWKTYFLLNAIASARPPGMELRTVGEFVWSVACNNSAVNQYGETFSEATHGCTEAPIVIIQTRYKFYLDAFEGDAAQTTFTLTQGSNTKYNVATSPVSVYVDGVPTAASCSAAGVVTITPAPADGAKIIVAYEYED